MRRLLLHCEDIADAADDREEKDENIDAGGCWDTECFVLVLTECKGGEPKGERGAALFLLPGELTLMLSPLSFLGGGAECGFATNG